MFLGIWGSVPVAGLTLDQIAESIREHLSRQEDPTKPGAGGFKKETLRVVADDEVDVQVKQIYSGEGGPSEARAVPCRCPS